MFLRLFLLFTLIPILELYLLVKIGTMFGALTAILLVVITGVVGAALARREGFGVWQKIQKQMAEGAFPAKELLDGLLILAAGIVLITPGILTDILGFMFLIPFPRSLYRKWLIRKLKGMMGRGDVNFVGFFRQSHMRNVNPDSYRYDHTEDADTFDDTKES